MKQWFRRIRGAIGVGISWGVAWGLVGGVLEVIFGLPPGSTGAEVVLREFARGFGALAAVGFLASGAFSVALALEGRHRSFAEMSLPRLGLWGGLTGLAVGLVLYGPFLMPLAIGVVVGGGSAAGLLALARRADDRELLPAGDEVSHVPGSRAPLP